MNQRNNPNESDRRLLTVSDRDIFVTTQKALLIGIVLKNETRADKEESLKELVNLVKTAGSSPTIIQTKRVDKIDPKTFIGKGSIKELVDISDVNDIDVVLFDCELTPNQQKELRTLFKCDVVDRTGLILEIFGARANTHEGRLQVELASLSFQRSRLVRSWTHLERQRGGAGFLGGPGERQIELDRRQIDSKIKYIKLELERVVKTRLLHRSSRSKKPVPIVAFVGYTNAGKSTLFNRLTGANVLADDMLFATLDPTMRKIELPSGRQIVLSDTVGFVSNLPTHLVAAFRATLEEVIEADIIVHIRDVSHLDTELQKYDVEQVLNYLGVYDTVENSNIIEVLNKTDKLEPQEYQRYSNNISENEVLLSAISGEGCATFYDKIDQLLGNTETIYNFQIKLNDGAAIAWLHANGIVKEKSFNKSYCFIEALLSLKNVKRFGKKFGDLQTVTAK